MDEIKKIEVQGQQYGVADMLMRSVMGGNAQVIEWSHTHNMNDYKEAGTYRIKGERTGNPLDDNLPIMNSGSGHTIEGVLYVLDSSLTNGSGETTDCTVTQFLILSNRVGGQEGDMYMRSGYGKTTGDDDFTWKPWEKYQTNMEVGYVNDSYTLNPSNPTSAILDKGMNHLKDNGIYSGIYYPPKAMIGTPDAGAVIQDENAIETFVMIVINNYLAAKDAKCVTQIKFSVTNGGVFSIEKRQPGFAWKPIGGSGVGEWEPGGNGFTIPNNVYSDRPIRFGNSISIGSGVHLEAGVNIAEKVGIGGDYDNGLSLKSGSNPVIYIGTHTHTHSYITLGKKVHISENVCIGTGFDANTITTALKIYVNEAGDSVIFSYNGKSTAINLI